MPPRGAAAKPPGGGAGNGLLPFMLDDLIPAVSGGGTGNVRRFRLP